jgi:transcriptional regulator with GAF, ATPase, and Fis domain
MDEPGTAPFQPSADALLEGMNAVFVSLGRALICLDQECRVVHPPKGLDSLLGSPVAERLLGIPAAELLGEDLFAPGAGLRRALEAGERREGWGATLRVPPQPPRLVSITAAPLRHDLAAVCDPLVAYLVVIRPADQSHRDGGPGPALFSGLIARSAVMLRIFQLVEDLEESDATVLISGESGTGKELVARAIHEHSPHRRGAFVAVNCGALPGELLESELFGHVRGAFTGAVRDREGRFELASDGTLFLDEVGDLPLHLQVKLLRVLQEHTFERVGESRSRRSDARIIAATNLDLRRAALEGRFRDDLFYRLRVVPIEVPPLRERREDIEPLVGHLLSRVSARHGRSLILAPEAMRALLGYDWPGNVRELENALEFAVAVSKGQTIQAQDLPAEVLAPAAAAATTSAVPGGAESATAATAFTTGDPAERRRLLAALEAHRWRRDETAAALGTSRTTLWRKMREHGLLR